VYANLYNRRGGSADFVLEPGATVRERQVLIRLPDPTKMQVKATINESRISLVQADMPVAIRLDAVKDRTLQGIVTKVNQYAEPGSWTSGNIKEYAAFIEILDPTPEIRTGMNAEVRIFVEQREDALQVPVQALYETKGHFFCLVKDGNRYETREVRVGSSNDTFMTIEEGLEEGQSVVMNPRAYPDQLELPELPDEEPVVVAQADDATSAGPPAADNAVDMPTEEQQAGADTSNRTTEEAAGGSDPPADGFAPSEVFARGDTDGDGTISAAELESLPAERRDALVAADGDGDGTVTREEFTQAMAQSPRGEAVGGGS
jgi:hypothetical protein